MRCQLYSYAKFIKESKMFLIIYLKFIALLQLTSASKMLFIEPPKTVSETFYESNVGRVVHTNTRTDCMRICLTNATCTRLIATTSRCFIFTAKHQFNTSVPTGESLLLGKHTWSLYWYINIVFALVFLTFSCNLNVLHFISAGTNYCAQSGKRVNICFKIMLHF